MHKNKLNFKGKKAIVTGGTRGIGKGIADLLSDLGGEVVATGTAQLDLANDKSIVAFIENMPDDADILINNAGINLIEPINEMNIGNFERIVKVNLTGCALLIKEVSSRMIKNNIKGKILNLSSIFGIVSKEKRASYSASKTGLIGLTRAAALDLAPHGILVNALCPGFTKTDLTASILSKNDIDLLCKEVPTGRFAEVEEIAKAAAFLCSDLNTYMTGQVLVVDGGFTIQ
ncbi:MAG: SDR family oxidoreductase [Candidatus Margulisbacteria bacterium]|nr:SDR family oxidoreductase [Candidatus Margulisiibacteriota bacterium]MBU1617111.1 SDR family oxidoreductase [Candidatus Margulisiibacteriota bacterium]